MKNILFLFLLFLSCCAQAQDAKLYGTIVDEESTAIEGINITINDASKAYYTITNEKGMYSVELPSSKDLTIVISYPSYEKFVQKINLAPKEALELNVLLKNKEMKMAIIKEVRGRGEGISTINPKYTTTVATTSDGVIALIKTQPGVASNNELSSQYNVRGGNFDENLVYINDFEIYRPFLVRSGQQEGLNFINADMVSDIKFSAGGFDAKYGDKMSSVLDIKYKKPLQWKTTLSASLLNYGATVEGSALHKRLSIMAAARYRGVQYLLKSLDTKGQYKPTSSDVQLYTNYVLNESSSWEVLANYNSTNYVTQPENRETDFGSANEAYRFTMYFDGSEQNKFLTKMIGSSFTNTKNRLQTKFLASYFGIQENENSDVNAEYWIREVQKDPGKANFGDAAGPKLGVGGFLTFIRNELKTNILNLEYKGSFIKTDNSHFLHWGIKAQSEQFQEKMNEWRIVDSAGYTLHYSPFEDTSIEVQDRIKNTIQLKSQRYQAYLQDNITWQKDSALIKLTAGIRVHYWTGNKQMVVSPRLNLSIQPNWKNTTLFRIAVGYYNQPPLYRELKDLKGNLHTDIVAQQSIHFITGVDWDLKIWQRPFKMIAEAFYKDLNSIVPYTVDNVRVRYYGNNSSKGYATGVDARLSGEFVEGTESWISLGVMKTMEDIALDSFINTNSQKQALGYIKRPSNQFLRAAIFYQDYFPNAPTWKMNMNLVFGTGLPRRLPNGNYTPLLKDGSAYRRIDIGMSKQLIGNGAKKHTSSALKYIESAWIGLEVFNLFGINNTVSYTWVKDYANTYRSIPNYLTKRLLNLRLIVVL